MTDKPRCPFLEMYGDAMNNPILFQQALWTGPLPTTTRGHGTLEGLFHKQSGHLFLGPMIAKAMAAPENTSLG